MGSLSNTCCRAGQVAAGQLVALILYLQALACCKYYNVSTVLAVTVITDSNAVIITLLPLVLCQWQPSC